MKSIYSRMAAVILTLSLGFAAGSASAVTYSIGSWTGTPLTGLNSTFSRSGISSLGTFTDWVTFSLPAGVSSDGAANSISLTSGGVVSFSLLDLYSWDTGLSTAISWIATGSTYSTPVNYAEIFFTGLTVPGDYALKVMGSNSGSNGSYSGNVVINPVPEPETYAMMLAGLGLLGFSARRRGSNS